jgi:predicted ATPase
VIELSTDRLHIITGAPGAGKTAIAAALRGDFTVFDEPAREVLAEWRSRGNPRPAQMEPGAFVELLLESSLANYQRAIQSSGAVVFDRGIPDCVAYATHLGADATPSLAASSAFRYSPLAFVARPWEEIYTTDDERTMSFDDTLRFQDAVDAAYRAAGYDLIDIPRGPVSFRAAFVIETRLKTP